MNAQKRGERSDSVVINAKMPLNSEVNKVKKEMTKQNHFGTNDRVAKDITQSSAQWGKWGVHMDIVISLRILFNIIFVSASVSHCQSVIGIVLLFVAIYRAEYTITSNF